jgi:hypothetical protein
VIWLGIAIGVVLGFFMGCQAALAYARDQVRQHAVDRMLATSFMLGCGDKDVPDHIRANLTRMRKEQGL